ncbi:L-rhamnose mutarotase [Celeribacter sp.]|uniref:L-rhamnose mutarotase n=1 Tax=Celeribacter sp. TaxID=1890673 RepID=UPI003A93B04B
MERKGFAIRVKPEFMEDYKRVHADVWPEVLDKIRDCNIRNYSIYLHEPEHLMFGYYEYFGTDYEADMAKMAADAKTQEWWALCMPMMAPLETRKDGEFWAEMDRIFLMEE